MLLRHTKNVLAKVGIPVLWVDTVQDPASQVRAILGRALGGIAHVGEEVRRPVARAISSLIRSNLVYEPEK